MPICRVHAKSNYTVINNKLLRSKNLSCAATGLLCKVMSFPEDWDYTVAGLVSVCKEGITAINTMLKELKELGYLVVTKLTPAQTKSGRFEYIYDFYEESEKDEYYSKGVKNPHRQREKNVEPNVENEAVSNKQASEKQDIEILPLEFLPVENPQQLNTNKSNTEKSITKSIYQSKKTQKRIDAIDEERAEITEYVRMNIDFDWYENYFAENDESVGTDTFAKSLDDVELLLNIIVNCICSEESHIRIGKQLIPHEAVESRFMKLNQEHIEYVLKSLMLTTTKIKNPKAYLLTALYNAPDTCRFMENTELKNIDPALFIPEKYHDDEFRERHYKNTAFIPSFDGA